MIPSLFRMTIIVLVGSIVVRPAMPQEGSSLPNAPNANLFIDVQQASSPNRSGTTRGTEDSRPSLTRAQAEKIALASNPRIQITSLLAKVQHQVREGGPRKRTAKLERESHGRWKRTKAVACPQDI